jgi:beta-lactam-binding protein with PASTA domain
VIGQKVAKAKAKIKKAHCRVGRITKARSRGSRVGRVIAQNPKPGKVKAAGFKVKLVVGRR